MDIMDPCLLTLFCILFKGLFESVIKILISKVGQANHKISDPIHV